MGYIQFAQSQIQPIKVIVGPGQTFTYTNQTASYTTLLAILAGGGGGGGYSSNSYGGGGGGSGAIIYLRIHLEPGDQISVSAGAPGSAGTSSTSATAGGSTTLTITDSSGNTYTFTAGGGKPGGNGGNTIGGSGSAGVTSISASANAPYRYSIIYYVSNGNAGTQGQNGATASGGASVYNTTVLQQLLGVSSDNILIVGEGQAIQNYLGSGAGGTGGYNGSGQTPGGSGFALLVIEP